MSELYTEQFTCPKCRQPWYYGWECLGVLKSFLLNGVTYFGADGVKTFKWIKCSYCKSQYKISGLNL